MSTPAPDVVELRVQAILARRRAMNASGQKGEDAALIRQAEEDKLLAANPDVGVLVRDGRRSFYMLPPCGAYCESRDLVGLLGLLAATVE